MSNEIKINKKIIWIAIIAVILIAIFFIFKNRDVPGNTLLSNKIGSQVGDIAPDFEITDINQEKFSLNQFKGKPVVLAFFATWCAPCQIEAGRLKQIANENPRKFTVYQIGVDTKESTQDLRQFKSNFGNADWIVGFGIEVAKQYNVRSLDTTLIIDENGNIIYRDNGVPASVETLRKYLT